MLINKCWFLRRSKVTSPLLTALLSLDKNYRCKTKGGRALGLYRECLLAISPRHSTEDPLSLPLNSKKIRLLQAESSFPVGLILYSHSHDEWKVIFTLQLKQK